MIIRLCAFRGQHEALRVMCEHRYASDLVHVTSGVGEYKIGVILVVKVNIGV